MTRDEDARYLLGLNRGQAYDVAELRRWPVEELCKALRDAANATGCPHLLIEAARRLEDLEEKNNHLNAVIDDYACRVARD
jgi:hypothetical protein